MTKEDLAEGEYTWAILDYAKALKPVTFPAEGDKNYGGEHRLLWKVRHEFFSELRSDGRIWPSNEQSGINCFARKENRPGRVQQTYWVNPLWRPTELKGYPPCWTQELLDACYDNAQSAIQLGPNSAVLHALQWLYDHKVDVLAHACQDLKWVIGAGSPEVGCGLAVCLIDTWAPEGFQPRKQSVVLASATAKDDALATVWRLCCQLGPDTSQDGSGVDKVCNLIRKMDDDLKVAKGRQDRMAADNKQLYLALKDVNHKLAKIKAML